MSAAVATNTAIRRRTNPMPSMAAAIVRPAAMTAVASHGCQLDERPSRTYAVIAVSPSATVSISDGEQLLPKPEERDRADADERADRRGQRDRVVRVEDARP